MTKILLQALTARDIDWLNQLTLGGARFEWMLKRLQLNPTQP